MSAQPPNADSRPGSAGDPEYLGAAVSEPAGGRRWGVLGAGALGVAAVVGLGSWGAVALLGATGDQPADALPASVVGYASLDLDPSASQKVEAFRILQKFPALQRELDLDNGDDLRRLVFEAMQSEQVCTDLDYEQDVAPWIGQRVAVAAVPVDEADAGDAGGDELKGAPVAPVVALAVTDREAAEQGLETLLACDDAAGDYGLAFVGDYALISDTAGHAEDAAAAAEEAALADDADFQEWTGRVGDPGILSFYVAPGAADLLTEWALHAPGSSPGAWMEYSAEPEGGDLGEHPAPGQRELEALAETFDGAAGALRFADGAVEVEVAGMAGPTLPAGEGTAPVADLPASTVLALSVALPEGWAADLVEAAERMAPAGEVEAWLAEVEAATGLTLPEDVEALLGEGTSLAVDRELDLQALFGGDLTRLPTGLRIDGEPDQVLPVVEKIRTAMGPQGGLLLTETGDGLVALGTNPDYLATLAGDGSLGEEALFQRAVPRAAQAQSVFFLDLDAGAALADPFLGTLAADEAATVRANLEPLEALGASSDTAEDGVFHTVWRLTTD